MDEIYAVEVGDRSNADALMLYLRSIQPEDLAFFIREYPYDPDDSTCITIKRNKNLMSINLGKPHPSWPAGLTETDSEGRKTCRSIVHSGSTLAFLGQTFLRGTGEENREFVMDYAEKLDKYIKQFSTHEAVWIDPLS